MRGRRPSEPSSTQPPEHGSQAGGKGGGARRARPRPERQEQESQFGRQPTVLGCTLFESATEGRIRAFYTVGTSRRSTSASIVNYGPSQAITWCLKWAWQTHSEHTGESCPWPELLERVCEPLS